MLVCCGSTSTARTLWRPWLVSKETRAVPTSCCGGCRTGTNTTEGAIPRHQVADGFTAVYWGSATIREMITSFSWVHFVEFEEPVLCSAVQQQGSVNLEEGRTMDRDTRLLCCLDLRGLGRPLQLPWFVRSVDVILCALSLYVCVCGFCFLVIF